MIVHEGKCGRGFQSSDALTPSNSKVITVINRSEVVGRPLGALLANDGARVLSVDIDCTPVSSPLCDPADPFPAALAIVEFSKRPSAASAHTSRFNPHHVVSPTNMTLQECLRVSDVVISAVPHKDYKVKTEWLKDGCVCVNVAGDKNFEADVRQKVRHLFPLTREICCKATDSLHRPLSMCPRSVR